MPTLRTDIVLRIGNGVSDATHLYPAVDNITPFMSWSLPDGMGQNRYSVLIESAEIGGTAYATSGDRVTTEQFFQFPLGSYMGEGFAGLCKATVQISNNSSGDFAWISSPLYFVFDTTMDRMFLADDVSIRWNAAEDTDFLPVGLRYFHVQICQDPQCQVVVHENSEIINLLDAAVTYTPDPEVFTPVLDVNYFFRVRQNDGYDWSDWSTTQAFRNQSNRMPTINITNVTPLLNEDGDVLIEFTVTDPENDITTVEFSYAGGQVDEDTTKPLSLVQSSIKVPVGDKSLIWKSGRQEPGLATGVIIYAVAKDSFQSSLTDVWGPISIDNRSSTATGTGIGSTRYTYPIRSFMASRSSSTFDTIVMPSQGKIAPVPESLRSISPVSSGPFAWPLSYANAPIEHWPDGQARFNISGQYAPKGSLLYFPPAMIPIGRSPSGVTTEASMTASYAPLLSGVIRKNPHATSEAWMFRSPIEYSQFSDAWPRPHMSRAMDHNQCLIGYVDRFGDTHEYPNNYDWASRPVEHIGNEVWSTDDAWVQLAAFKFTHFDVCDTCQGKNWIPSTGGAPYTRLACTNPDCENGFDVTEPLTDSIYVGGELKTWRLVKTYIDVQWYRLSTLVGMTVTRPHRHGTSVSLPQSIGSTQFIAGRGLSDLEAETVETCEVVGIEEVCETEVVGYRHTTESGIVVALDAGAAVSHPTNNDPSIRDGLVRDHRGGVAIRQHVAVIAESVSSGDSFPSIIEFSTPQAFASDNQFVLGTIGPERENFSMGADIDQHPGHARRYRHAQSGVPLVNGFIGQSYDAQALEFVFLQQIWDAYNTIHWRMTASATPKIQMQFARFFPGGSQTAWQDVRADNSEYDDVAGRWLVDPLTFHAYWNTASRSLYTSGGTYRLRIRQVDLASQSYSEWATSLPFVIQSGVSNPVNIMTMTYEPWSRIVTLGVRVDDSEQNEYTMTRFWYSSDDGVTWAEINRGDIVGETTFLSSEPSLDQNLHEIMWLSSNYNLGAGNKYRVRIEAVPSSTLDSVQLPFFRWLSPLNPYVDAAERRLIELMGRLESRYVDPVTNEWVEADPPVYRSGQIRLLQMEYARIQEKGYWDYVDEGTGTVLDLPGLTAWYLTRYSARETYGQAMARIQALLDRYLNVEVPALNTTIQEQEQAIRKDLIRQGFYAEQWFAEDGDDFIEEIDIHTLVDYVANDSGGTTIKRPWRFRVQSASEIDLPVVDEDTEEVRHNEQTLLEVVRYKVQLDKLSTFDSQPRGQPLREFTTNNNGAPLSIAKFEVPTTEVSATDDTGQPWDQKPVFGNEAFDSSLSDETSMTIGGVLKVVSSDLPGTRDTDALPDGDSTFNGNYVWRVSAYNPIPHQITARPRPRVSSINVNAPLGVIFVDYTLKAHGQITHASLTHTVGSFGTFNITGYQVSRTTTTPSWVNVEPIDFVSDRRTDAAGADGEVINNGQRWVPEGIDRPSPCVIYDDAQSQYMLFHSKLSFSNKWRIMTARSMSLPTACEYEVLFENSPWDALYGPSVVRHEGQYLMYMTGQMTAGTPRILVSTSDDGEAWTSPVEVEVSGLAMFGAYPSAVVDGDDVIVFAEQAGVITQYSSTDTTSFDLLTSFSGSRPAAIILNGAMVVYYVDGGLIKSGILIAGTMTSIQTEISSTLIEGDLAVPSNPYVYADDYLGNAELFMVFNYQLIDGTNLIYQSRLEDRIWVNGVVNKIYGASGNLVNVECSPEGEEKACSVDMAAHGVLAGDSVKIRLLFTVWSPDIHEFHRRSEWVDATNVIETESYLDPMPWTFNEQLLQHDYLT